MSVIISVPLMQTSQFCGKLPGSLGEMSAGSEADHTYANTKVKV